jgi:hypothetical protein
MPSSLPASSTTTIDSGLLGKPSFRGCSVPSSANTGVSLGSSAATSRSRPAHDTAPASSVVAAVTAAIDLMM